MNDARAHAELNAAESGRRVIFNAAVMLVKQIVMVPLGVVFVGFMARRLGVAIWGEFQASLAIASIVSIFAGIGVRGYIAREIAVDPSRGPRGLGSALLIRGGLGAVLLAGTSLIIAFAKGGTTAVLVAVAALSQFSAILFATTWLAFEVAERFELILYVELAARGVVISVGSFLLLRGAGVVAVALVFLAGNVLELVMTLHLARTRLYAPVFALRWSELRDVLLKSLPIGVLSTIFLAMQQCDRVVLRALAGEEQVGVYSAAWLLSENMNLLPDLFLSTAFSAGMRLFVSDRAAFAHTYRAYLTAALVLGFPIAAGVYLLAGDAIGLVYGSGRYAASAPVLRVLVCQVPLAFIFHVATLPLLAAKRERELAKLLSVALVMNVVLGVVLVPRMGALGAAVATLVVWSGAVVGTAWLSRAWMRLASPARVLGTAASTLLLIIATRVTRGALGPWWAGALGGVVYVAGLLALRGLTVAELRALVTRRVGIDSVPTAAQAPLADSTPVSVRG
jgi:O-antigen/teichoic acid export membrane protein